MSNSKKKGAVGRVSSASRSADAKRWRGWRTSGASSKVTTYTVDAEGNLIEKK